jgi:hypothetical protein
LINQIVGAGASARAGVQAIIMAQKFPSGNVEKLRPAKYCRNFGRFMSYVGQKQRKLLDSQFGPGWLGRPATRVAAGQASADVKSQPFTGTRLSTSQFDAGAGIHDGRLRKVQVFKMGSRAHGGFPLKLASGCQRGRRRA